MTAAPTPPVLVSSIPHVRLSSAVLSMKVLPFAPQGNLVAGRVISREVSDQGVVVGRLEAETNGVALGPVALEVTAIRALVPHSERAIQNHYVFDTGGKAYSEMTKTMLTSAVLFIAPILDSCPCVADFREIPPDVLLALIDAR